MGQIANVPALVVFNDEVPLQFYFFAFCDYLGSKICHAAYPIRKLAAHAFGTNGEIPPSFFGAFFYQVSVMASCS